MKLYEEYKKLLKSQFDDGYSLKKAWFTTFTLSPEFFESFLLPPLLNKEDEVPKTFVQFEEIIGELKEREGELSLKVFYDAAMPVDGIKKTTVPFIGIRAKEGLFHPKLNLLVFQKEKSSSAYIMVGSANIGLDGWGRNREAVTVKQIETNLQREQVNSFFKEFSNEEPLKNLKLNHSEHNEEVDWSLIYTGAVYRGRVYNFLDEVAYLEEAEWKVWSPYFSNSKFVREVEQKAFTELKVIPDLVEGRKIRMKSKPDFNIYDDNDEKNDSHFTHAKVWLSKNYLIVGSHNLTEAALEHRNYEASVLQPLIPEMIGTSDQVLLSLVEGVESMEEEELKEQDLPETLAGFSINIEADHSSKKITLKTQLMDVAEFPLIIYLPGGIPPYEIDTAWHGNTKSINLELCDKDAVKFWRALVTEKQVTAEFWRRNSSSDQSLKKVFGSGFIEEVGIEARQAFRYESLQSLMIDQLISNVNSENSRYLVHSSEMQGFSGISVEGAAPAAGFIDYFQVYSFFLNLKLGFQKLKKNSYDELKERIFYLPNSLFSVKELIEQLESQQQLDSTVYLSVLKYEFNELVKFVKKEFSSQEVAEDILSELNDLLFKKESLIRQQRAFLRKSYQMELQCE